MEGVEEERRRGGAVPETGMTGASSGMRRRACASRVRLAVATLNRVSRARHCMTQRTLTSLSCVQERGRRLRQKAPDKIHGHEHTISNKHMYKGHQAQKQLRVESLENWKT